LGTFSGRPTQLEAAEFLGREIIDAIHEEHHGLRDENGLESAIAAAENVYWYGSGDVFEIAATFKIATHEMNREDLAQYFRLASAG